MAISRNIFWIAFFASILAAWWWLYSMSLSMNMDLLGRMSMENPMVQMDMPKENMSQMSGEGDMASMKIMSLDNDMNSEQAMSKEKQMALMQKWVIANLFLNEENPPTRLDYSPMEIISKGEYDKHPIFSLIDTSAKPTS